MSPFSKNTEHKSSPWHTCPVLNVYFWISMISRWINIDVCDLLKSNVGEYCDAQKDGGYTTSNVGNHSQNLTVTLTYWGSWHILKYNLTGDEQF